MIFPPTLFVDNAFFSFFVHQQDEMGIQTNTLKCTELNLSMCTDSNKHAKCISLKSA